MGDEVAVRLVGDRVVATFGEELDRFVGEDAWPAIVRAMDGADLPLVLDLSNVTFMDGGGLRLTILARKTFGPERVTVQASPRASAVFVIAGLGHLVGR